MINSNFEFYIDANGNTCSIDNPGIPVIWATSTTGTMELTLNYFSDGIVDDSFDSMNMYNSNLDF